MRNLKAHQRCKQKRTNRGTDTVWLAARGRPIGFLAAWLLEGDRYDTEEEHTNQFVISALDYDTRRQARESIRNDAGYVDLASHERGKRLGEGDEPVDRC